MKLLRCYVHSLHLVPGSTRYGDGFLPVLLLLILKKQRISFGLNRWIDVTRMRYIIRVLRGYRRGSTRGELESRSVTSASMPVLVVT